jgi:hypothetical protein
MFRFKLKGILDLYKKPSHVALAQDELDDAKRDLLAAQTALAYAEAAVSFNSAQVVRLTEYLAECSPTKAASK